MQKALSTPPGPGVAPAGQSPGHSHSKTLLLTKCCIVMKLVIIIIILACLQSSATGYSQKISISVLNAPLEKAFEQVEKQTPYRFIYTKEVLTEASPITVDLKNVDLIVALDLCFNSQPLEYIIEEYNIVVRKKKGDHPGIIFHELKGRIVTADEEPIAGVTVTVKGTKQVTITDKNGEFVFSNIEPSDVLIISGAEIETTERRVNNLHFLHIVASVKVNELDQVLVMAYGETTRRLNTGNISKVTFR